MTKPLVIFTYAPAGLGHLRVTDAFINAMPSEVFESVVFSPQGRRIELLHRFSSQNNFAKRVMEWFQSGTPQGIFTTNYRNYLKNNTTDLFLEFTSLIKSQPKPPRTIIIISTHFSLSHQLGVIKERLEKYLKIKIYLIVQVTDDSPQYIWYVDSANLIFVPSNQTAKKLEAYGQKENLRKVDFKVLPYPINPLFSQQLSPFKISHRRLQFDPNGNHPINIVIPISGAAVGTNFFIKLIEELNNLSNRFTFFVVCRKAKFTQKFINQIKNKKNVNLFISDNYQKVVDMYNSIYQKNVISAEITKPSEQAFKALTNYQSVGGSFIFFAKPVGRQEYDNLQFLKRNHLLSTESKGTLLPNDPIKSAKLIHRIYQNGKLLETFDNYKSDGNNPEVGDNGVKLFWQEIENLVKNNAVKDID